MRASHLRAYFAGLLGVASVFSWAAVCWRPPVKGAVAAQVERILADPEHELSLAVRQGYYDRDGTAYYPIGHGIELAGCDGYAAEHPDVKSGKAWPGYHGLARDLQTQLREGLACMTDRSKPESLGNYPGVRDAAAKLAAFLVPGYTRPVRLHCIDGVEKKVHSYDGDFAIPKGGFAAAYPDCTNPAFPTVGLDVSRTNDLRAGVGVFHEILHLAGYDHGRGIDYPYLVAQCCMEPDRNQALACEILRKTTDWRSADYLTRWAIYMGQGRGSLRGAIEPIFNAMLDARSDQRQTWPAIETWLLLGQGTLEEHRDSGWPVFGLVLARAAIEGLPVEKREEAHSELAYRIADRYYPTSDATLLARRNFAMRLGHLLGKALVGASWEQVNLMSVSLGNDRDAACPLLTEGDRKSVNELGKRTFALFHERTHAMFRSQRVDWNGAICPTP